MKNLKLLLVSLAILFSHNFTVGQGSKDSNKEKSAVKSALNAFKFRSIGPAFMSGRIADIAIDPMNENVWYVACLLYTSPSPRDLSTSRMPSSA